MAGALQQEPVLRVLLPAGGSGERFGRERPKLLCDLGGEPVLLHSVRRMRALEPASLVVAVPAADRDAYRAALPGSAGDGIVWVDGGASRAESVRRCFDACPDGDPGELVMIHDAARPLVSMGDCRRLLEAALETGAAILGRTPVDTVKRRLADDRAATLPRQRLFLAETPQVVRRDLFGVAWASSGRSRLSDDAQLLEALDRPGVLVEATSPNPKLTYRHELPLFEALLRSSPGEVSDAAGARS